MQSCVSGWIFIRNLRMCYKYQNFIEKIVNLHAGVCNLLRVQGVQIIQAQYPCYSVNKISN